MDTVPSKPASSSNSLATRPWNGAAYRPPLQPTQSIISSQACHKFVSLVILDSVRLTDTIKHDRRGGITQLRYPLPCLSVAILVSQENKCPWASGVCEVAGKEGREPHTLGDEDPGMEVEPNCRLWNLLCTLHSAPRLFLCEHKCLVYGLNRGRDKRC